jgi:O-phosphoseryl-tRNA(Cys) synthetase
MEFFKDTFSCEPLNEDIDTENNIKELKIDTKPISKQEIRKAIKNMKNGKAPGPDNITAELLQADMETTVNILHKLLYEIWNTEQVPEEWKTGLLVKYQRKEIYQDVKTGEA